MDLKVCFLRTEKNTGMARVDGKRSFCNKQVAKLPYTTVKQFVTCRSCLSRYDESLYVKNAKAVKAKKMGGAR